MWVFDREKGKGRGKGCCIGTAQRWVLAKRNIQRANEWTHVRYFPTQWQLYSVSTLPTFPLALSGWIIGHVGHVLREQLPRNLFRKLRSLHSFFFFKQVGIEMSPFRCTRETATFWLLCVRVMTVICELQAAAQNTWVSHWATNFCMTVANTCIWALL